MTWMRGFLLALALLAAAATPGFADPFIQEPLRILLPGDLGRSKPCWSARRNPAGIRWR
jgi:hypothetical protein